MNTAI